MSIDNNEGYINFYGEFKSNWDAVKHGRFEFGLDANGRFVKRVGTDRYGDTGKLMPDGLTERRSIFKEDPNGFIVWEGSRYSLKVIVKTGVDSIPNYYHHKPKPPPGSSACKVKVDCGKLARYVADIIIEGKLKGIKDGSVNKKIIQEITIDEDPSVDDKSVTSY